MVAILDSNGQFCAGTLVASKYVISAAHCMFVDEAGTTPYTTSQLQVGKIRWSQLLTLSICGTQVRLGEHDLSTTGEGSLEMTLDVASYTNHENYNKVTTDNDITIIELAQEVDITIYTPACLAKTSDTTTFDGKNAWVYG